MTKQKSHSLRPYLLSYLNHIRGGKWKFIVVIILFMISQIFLVIVPLFIGLLVDAASSNMNDLVWKYAWILVALSTLHQVTWHIAEYVYLRLIQVYNFTFETRLFQTVIASPYPYFVNKFSGKISSYINKIRDENRLFIEDIFWSYSQQIIGIVGLAFVFSTVNWQTTALFFAGLLVMGFVGYFAIRPATLTEQIETDVNATKNGYIFDAISNFANIKSFKTEYREEKIVGDKQSKTITAAHNSFVWGIFFWASVGLIIRNIIWPIAILMNAWFYINGQMTIGQLATILSAILLFSTNIWDAIFSLSQLRLRFARIEEAFSYLFEQTVLFSKTTKIIGDTSEKTLPINKLEIRNLSFAYPDKPEDIVLNGIDLTIDKGQRIGLVGKSGSGKSTLVSLLLNHYAPTSGKIIIDGNQVEADLLAHNTSYVPQDTALFHRTISENIGYASHRTVSSSEIQQAAIKAEAHDFITKLSDGYNTMVGERGVKLSGGQRQRVAIARALLKDAPLLILDEATSALDSESESSVQKAIDELWKNKTALVIAHRLSTIAKLDRIIVLSNGKIIEDGTHTELLERDGEYARLWKHQSGGFLEE